MIALLPKVRENGYERKERLEVNMAREAKMVSRVERRAEGRQILGQMENRFFLEMLQLVHWTMILDES